MEALYKFGNAKIGIRLLGLLLTGLLFAACAPKKGEDYREWSVYKGDPSSSSYSALTQINKDNVDQLEVAWTYRTGDLTEDSRTMETNPIIVDEVLYAASPHLRIFAVDAGTGEQLWMFDPFGEERARGYLRSVVYWQDGADRRILFTAGTWLHALDAGSGELIAGFGDEGKVSLNKGLGRDPETISVKASSPGIIYDDLLILGSAVGESYDAAPGHIRAYDVRTGEIVWTFHTLPQPGEPGFETWQNMSEEELRKRGGANNWAGMSLDKDRGIVYIPLGSPVYDFYGGNRPGKNLYGNSLVALDAATGNYIWHYQTVHHDLWDYDLPAPPNLLTVEKDGRQIDAVAQVTKTGFTFVFNRVTGEPLFPVEERAVPPSHIESEEVWPTQPFPTAPKPFIRQNFTKDEITDISPQARDSVLAAFSKYRNEGFFTPPDPGGTIVFPSTRGGANWGGAAHDPETGILYINANETPELSTVKKVRQKTSRGQTLFEKGEILYVQNCATCHGMSREGQHPTYPPLNNIKETHSREEVMTIIEEGGGMMPAFAALSKEKKDAIIAYLFDQKRNTAKQTPGHETKEITDGEGRFINVTAYSRFEGPDGFPAIKPPWGTLNAINLNTGETVWRIPLGTDSRLARQGITGTGLESAGGPVVTAGGLVFIGATKEEKIRAFDKETGDVLWQATLPTGGFATPATYMVKGRQYVVIAAGGGRGTDPGDYYVAFTLPDQDN